MTNLKSLDIRANEVAAWLEEHAIRYSLVALRILMGLLWFQNTAWKHPPFNTSYSFGKYVKFAVDYPVFSPFSWFVETTVIPNLTLFGYMIMVVEGALAISMLLGLYTRTFALVGIFQSLFILFSVVRGPGEYGWAYWMILLIHVAIFASAGGGRFSVDHVVNTSDSELRRRAQMTLGSIVMFFGAIALLRNGFSLANGPGARLWHQGDYVPWGRLARLNGRGSTLIILMGAAGFVGAYMRQKIVAGVVAAIGAVAAFSILRDINIPDLWLGEGNTSNGVLYLIVAAGFATLAFAEKPSSELATSQ